MVNVSHRHMQAQYLLNLPGAKERLKIFPNVDLLVADSFEEAMAGCDAVLHTASPFYMGRSLRSFIFHLQSAINFSLSVRRH